ncbi:hypothetical protein [Mucilaginibacter sp. CSA2-8R]|uniref:hypothetical protein n=1 Tax=Mucilaginibacter sp. CSA2-8R TaxID=3141542 RepID=UPI00315DC350
MDGINRVIIKAPAEYSGNMNSLKKVIMLVVACYLSVLDINAQTKPNLFVFFKEDASNGVFKRSFSELSISPDSGNLYDIYLGTASGAKYQFATKGGTKVLIVDQKYAKRIHPKSIGWLKNRKETLWPTWSKKFPYKHLYLLEKLSGTKYKVTEVETFIGEDF